MTATPHTDAGALPARADIPGHLTWALADLYPATDAWERDFTRVSAMIDEAAVFKGTLGESGERLLAWLQFLDELNVVSGRLGNYAFRKYDEDTADTVSQDMVERVTSLGSAYAAAVSWAAPELVQLGAERVRAMRDATPALAVYAHHLDDILRTAAHTLSEPEERLLALALEPTGAPAAIFGSFNDADIRFGRIRDERGEEVEVTKGRYVALQESPDRTVRESAFHAMYGVYDGWKNSTASMLSGQVKRDIFYARARKYASSRHAALDRDNIPVEVYDTVVASVNANLAPLHRAMALRARLLGVERLRPWDLFVPLSHEPPAVIAWEDAAGMVQDGLAALGDDYAQLLRTAFADRWIDVMENRGKSAGAYSAWTYGAHPFVLLNYTGTLKDVFTVAHELGHSMHSWHTWKSQPPVYGDYSIFCAEVASTTNEVLLARHLLDGEIGRDMRFHLVMHLVETIRGTVYNQVLFAEFEQEIHAQAERGGALTASWMSGLMRELYERYYGRAFEMHDLFAVNWSRIPHFYRGFYVFQYATGLSAGALLAQRIHDGAPGALERYMRFLSAGSSAYSTDLLRDAGVDFSTSAPVDAVAALMNALLDEVDV